MEIQFEYINGFWTYEFVSEGVDKVLQLEQEKGYDVRVYANLDGMNKTLVYTDYSHEVDKIVEISVPESVTITVQSDSPIVKAKIA